VKGEDGENNQEAHHKGEQGGQDSEQALTWEEKKREKASGRWGEEHSHAHTNRRLRDGFVKTP